MGLRDFHRNYDEARNYDQTLTESVCKGEKRGLSRDLWKIVESEGCSEVRELRLGNMASTRRASCSGEEKSYTYVCTRLVSVCRKVDS